jgi:hypothetical protein
MEDAMATQRKVVVMGGNLLSKGSGTQSGPYIKFDGGKVVQIK